MNRRSGAFWDVISTLLLLVIGGALLYGNLIDRSFGDQILFYLQAPLTSAFVGALMVLSVLLRWIGGLGSKADGFINFESDGGSVGISVRAIRDFVERTAKEFSAVKNVDSTLLSRQKKLEITLRVKVQAGNPIPEFSQVMQQRIRESMSDSLGIDQIGRITIHISEIVGDAVQSDDHVALLD
ncbi:MAG TPA: alkaline shock response membrane anchor protein AmaP [Verrucomicrobia bacterium]|nr:hypothetical protein [Kiritimatiellaceae bacterium]HBO87771.1 alkaline shock response membrane anchor protein AmaP [Verrucomicrobiota bacterium]